MEEFKIETKNGETIISSASGRKYLLTEAVSIGNRKTFFTNDLCVIFELVSADEAVVPLNLVDYFYGVSGSTDEELLRSAAPYIREYEKLHRNDFEF